MSKRFSSKNRQLGQGMSEYIIITALIAVAAIGVFAAFGDVLTNQTAAMALEMSGQNADTYVQDAATDANRAGTYATQDEGLENYNQQNTN